MPFVSIFSVIMNNEVGKPVGHSLQNNQFASDCVLFFHLWHLKGSKVTLNLLQVEK